MLPKLWNSAITKQLSVPALLVVLMLISVRPASAASLTVDSTADIVANDSACTLREAILNANNDDQSGSTDCTAGAGADTITVPAGTYTLDAGSGQLLITTDLEITGAGAGSTIIQADSCDPTDGSVCTHTHRVFGVTGASTHVTLSGLTIQHGRVTGTNGGGIVVTDANLTLTASILRNNRVENGQGGGIYANQPITITNSTITNNQAFYDNNANPILGYGGGLYATGALLDNSMVSANEASYAGGGIFNDGGTLTLQNGSQVTENDSGAWGGGIFNYGGSVTLNDSSQVSDNTTGRGGGIYTINNAAGSATITLTDASLVQGNWSAFFGGGIFNQRAVTDTLAVVTLEDSSQIYDNHSEGGGGGVYNWGFSTADPSYGAALKLMDSSQIISNTGKNGGGVYLYENSTITANGGQIVSNAAQEKGGGVYVRDGFIDATDSSVLSNRAIVNAGGIYLERGNVTLGNTQVDENQASDMAGAIYIDAGTLLMTGGSVSQNQAANAGGGLVVSSGNLTLNATEIISNVSVNAHGGGLWNNAGTVTVTDTVIANNRASSNGGAIQNNTGVLTMSGGEITENTAVNFFGGALYNVSGQATFTQTLISGNQAVAGGAMRNQNSTAILHISQSEVLSNTATSGNGGALLMINGQVSIAQTTLAHNQASSTGGAIRANSGNLAVVNSTISSNSATTDGGALYLTNATVTLINTTITDNSGDALAQSGTGPINAGNTIIANPVSGNDCASGLHLISDGHNLASDSSCTGLTATGDLTNINPLLSPLQNNGGATATHTLLAGSPALEAGDNALCPATDQRGVTRPQGTVCDIGAVEVQVINSSVTQTGVTTAYNPVAQPCAATGSDLPIYTITPTLQNISANTFTDLFFRVKTLEYTADQGGLVPSLCNATTVVNNGGVGSLLTIPNGNLPGGDFGPGDTLSQTFEVGLPVRAQFRISVDLFSSRVSAAGSSQESESVYVGSLMLTFDPTNAAFTPVQQLFLPLVTR